MSFNVSADAYGRFMGTYSEPLAPQFADLAGVTAGQRALDVGCGPGALTAELIRRLGVDAVCAVEPSESFLASAQERFPGCDIRSGAAESLPFADGTFDRTLAQLVVPFMADAATGLTQMLRVTKPGGLVAASVWDHEGGRGPLSVFWTGALRVDPTAADERPAVGARQGDLAGLFETAGLDDVQETSATVTARFDTFEQWWDPMTLGVGPAGDYLAKQSVERREAIRARCTDLLPSAPFELNATAWCVTGAVVRRA